MNPALIVALSGAYTAWMLAFFPEHTWVGRNVAPFVGTLGVVVAVVAGLVGLVWWLI